MLHYRLHAQHMIKNVTNIVKSRENAITPVTTYINELTIWNNLALQLIIN